VLISGNEAVALAAYHAGVMLRTAYPGTPSTEIMEELAALGGPAQWCPNEKVAYEVALGGAFANGARTLAAMKHVGLNVAADPLFTPAVFLKEGQDLDDPDDDTSTPVNRRTLNVALLGVLSKYLDLSDADWLAALHRNLPKKFHSMNEEVFAFGRNVGRMKDK
jgi:hypothetical protein